MEFQKKRYTFRGMDGYAGFRHGTEYELELGTSEADDERPAEVVIVNPVSKLWMYCSKPASRERWQSLSPCTCGGSSYRLCSETVGNETRT